MSDFRPDDSAIAAVKSELLAYETQRQSSHRLLRLMMPLALIPAGLFALYVLWALASASLPFWAKDRAQLMFNGGLAVLLLGSGGVLLASLPSKRLQQSLRDRLLPSLFSFIGEIDYAHGKTPFTFEYLPKAALPTHSYARFGDVISGRHAFMQFELFELILRDEGRKTDKEVFKGIGLSFDIPVQFSGLLMATPRMGTFATFWRDTFSAPLSTLNSGDAALDAAFEFRTDNPGDAHDLIIGPLAKALAAIGDEWRDGPPRLTLSGNIGFLLIPSTKDFFELPDINYPAAYEGHIEPMLADFARLLETAAHARRAMAGKDGARPEPGLLA